LKIAVFMGGISSERDVSLWSGTAILESLQKQGYDAYGVDVTHDNIITAFTENIYDLAYLAFHGEYGEDGRIQGLLDLLGKTYTGSGVTSSAIAMDKVLTKKIAQSIRINTAKAYNSLEEIDDFPIVIKPAREGSSVGLYICNSKDEANKALDKLKNKKVVIEEYIKGEELTVGVINGESLGVLKIIPQKNITYDFDSKYSIGGSIHEYPAKISQKAYDKAMKEAALIHQELGLAGISRSDFLLRDDRLYFLEVNTCPGMTKTSLIPDLATLKGYSYDDITRLMVETFKK